MADQYDALADAIQAFIAAEEEDDTRIVTAYVFAAETVTLHEPDTNYVSSGGHGSYATRAGLAHILTRGIMEDE